MAFICPDIAKDLYDAGPSPANVLVQLQALFYVIRCRHALQHDAECCRILHCLRASLRLIYAES